LVASDWGRQDELAANTEEDNGWNDAWRVEKLKKRRLYLVIFGYIYFNLVKLGLALAPVFGLGACCAFLVFFFGEVNAKSQRRQDATRL
jgi:hypothetical protein